MATQTPKGHCSIKQKEQHIMLRSQTGVEHVDIDSAWQTVRENIDISTEESLGYCELKKHKPLFDEGCSILLHQSK
jgi:hypothetical protein